MRQTASLAGPPTVDSGDIRQLSYPFCGPDISG
ncbi:hypothetical protein RPHASCH2410_CH09540 [Rhizobium phaseoli Ch24-10]|nr:hypothetical protein RPHASCH2410_CH09540 [Rhizobium phaseoli Ch24-10]